MKKRFLALALCLLMALGVLPLGAMADALPEYAPVLPDGPKRSAAIVNPYYEEYYPELDAYMRKELDAAVAARKADAAAGPAKPRATVTTVEDAGAELIAGLKTHASAVSTVIRMPVEAVDTDIERENLGFDIYLAAFRTSTDPLEGDYIRRSIYAVDYEWSDQPLVRNGYMFLEYVFTTIYWGGLTATHERQMAAAADAVIKGLNFSARTSNYDKILKIYRWIADNVAYDNDALEDGAQELLSYDQTAYSAIMDRKTVCAGFSQLMYYMLWKCQIPCRYIVGEGGRDGQMGGHAWNTVWLRGEWYNLDITWDETSLYGRERYFLRGSDTDFYRYDALKNNPYHVPSGPEDDWGFDNPGLVRATSPTDYGPRREADAAACLTHVQAETTWDAENGGRVYWCAKCGHTQLEPYVSEPLAVASVAADKTSAKPGDTVTWTAKATGGAAPLQYCFYIYKDGAVVKKGSYGSANAFSYKAADPGVYTAKAFVRDAAGATANLTGGKVTVSAAGGAPTVASVTANRATSSVGSTVTWTATATGGTAPLQYCFYIYRDGRTVFKGSYGSAKSVSYKLTAAGIYTAKAFVKDAAGRTANLLGGTVAVGAPLAVVSLTADRTSSSVGETVTWTAAAEGGSGALQYNFYVYRNGKTVFKGSYGSAKSVSYKLTAAGTYTVKAFVKDAAGTVASLGGGTVAVA